MLIPLLKYLVNATELLMLLMVMLGVICGYAFSVYDKTGKVIMRCGAALGAVFAIVMYIFKTYTNKINTGTWNLRLYVVTITAFVIFILFTILSRKLKKVGPIGAAVGLALAISMMMLDLLPEFMTLPHTAMLTEDSALSSSFLIKMVGVLFGLIITGVGGIAVYHCVKTFSRGKTLLMTVLVMTINLVENMTAGMSILLARRVIPTTSPLYHPLFVLAKYVANLSIFFTYAAMLVAAIAVIALIVRSLHVNEPYSNPAEHRKIKAKWRNRRRWCATALICFALALCNIIMLKPVANKVAELSPIEDSIVEDGYIYVSFDQVNDGNLHRFAYTSDSGVQIRFIVIQKPGSNTYGVGLDACDICGETGYYQKGEYVICNLCDQPINIQTIGFEGGCNPIVIPDWYVDNGYIIVPIDQLVAVGESEFK